MLAPGLSSRPGGPSQALALAALQLTVSLRADFQHQLRGISNCWPLFFQRGFCRDTDSLLSLCSPFSLPPPLPLPSVGSTSSSPALLGIRDPRSEYDRTQPPMQYYNSQGDATHKGLYPGKTPAGCVIDYLEKPLISRHPASGLGSSPCLYWDGPPAADPIPVSPFPASGVVVFSACFKENKLR